MTPEQMREQSAAKVKQVMHLMKLLHLNVEARQRVNEQGFIELIPYWVDNETYATPPTDQVVFKGPTGPTGKTPEEPAAAPTGATGKNA